MKGFRAPTEEQAGALIAMSAVLFGGWVRLLIPQMAGFPVNDGGLFYVMLHDLQANGLRLPEYVQYNGLSIPFAYPPLGFYVGAIVATVPHLDTIQVLQWLPAVVTIATLPAFYWLSRAVLGTAFRAGIATLVFAFTPRAITWQIMGGGLTRSFGQLFLVLALAAIYLTFADYTRKRLLLAVLFSSLVVLSHPEAALQTVGGAVLLWLFKGRSRSSAIHALAIGTGTITISALWWVPALIRYGAGALLSAAQTGLHNWVYLFQPLLLNFVDEPMMTLIAVFGLIGIALELSKRRLLLPLWFVIPFIVDPRSAPTVSTVPLAMLAALALTEVVLPALAGSASPTQPGAAMNRMQSRPVAIFLAFVGLYMFGAASYFGTQLAGTALNRGTREAFAWVRANTPPGSKFLVLTGNTQAELFCDAPLEWFPAETQRISLTTIQGREWTQGRQFGQITAEAQAVSACLTSDQPLQCLEAATGGEGAPLGYGYLFVARKAPLLKDCRATGTSMVGERLVEELRSVPQYAMVYENSEAAVFSRR